MRTGLALRLARSLAQVRQCCRSHVFLACDCNQHGTAACDSISGACSCTHNTTGTQCEQCQARFFGNALNGGMCTGEGLRFI